MIRNDAASSIHMPFSSMNIINVDKNKTPNLSIKEVDISNKKGLLELFCFTQPNPSCILARRKLCDYYFDFLNLIDMRNEMNQLNLYY